MLMVSHIINRDKLLLSTDLGQAPNLGYLRHLWKTWSEAAAPLDQAQFSPLIIKTTRHWPPATDISFLSLPPPSMASTFRYRQLYGLQFCAKRPHISEVGFQNL